MQSIQFERYSIADNTGIDVAAVSVKLVEARDRRDVLISNSGAAAIWLALGAGPAVIGQGIYLAPGAAYSDDSWAGEAHAVCVTGSVRVGVTEKFAKKLA